MDLPKIRKEKDHPKAKVDGLICTFDIKEAFSRMGHLELELQDSSDVTYDQVKNITDSLRNEVKILTDFFDQWIDKPLEEILELED